MFYSHQLLARKAPLGQIWMAATIHAKFNRRKLSKLNIIKICEQILNPQVPMALRLSGILMGGVVIVYERKVKLLLDDVTRLLVEINEAWKVKDVSDPTLLPKGKSQAKRQSITLPKNQDEDLGEIEQSVQYTNTRAGFQRTAFIEMRLDNIDDLYVNLDPMEDLTTDCHQADAANITLFERFESYEGGSILCNHFERFDIQEDEDIQVNSVHQDHTEMPSTFIPSPVPQDEPKSDGIQEGHPAEMADKKFEEHKKSVQDQQTERRQGPARRRAKISPSVAMDYEQTIIPGQIYQSWLQNTSDIVRRRPTKRKNSGPMSTMKISRLSELPPTVLYGQLFTNGTTQVYYPFMEMWMRSIQPPHDSPSGRTSPPQPPEPSSTTERVHFDPPEYPAEDFSAIGSPSAGVSIEKQRANVFTSAMPSDVLMQEFETNLRNSGVQPPGLNGSKANLMTTPRNSDGNMRYVPSSGSGHDLHPHYPEVHSGSKKRRYSASLHSGSSLGTVPEESLWHNQDTNFKLKEVPENGQAPEIDLMVETGPTQTQKPPVLDEPVDHITESIRMQLKAHFDTPGSPRVESLNQLASGMNKKRAAHLFYQTCVLATKDIIKVEQKEAYGDINISRGCKM